MTACGLTLLCALALVGGIGAQNALANEPADQATQAQDGQAVKNNDNGSTYTVAVPQDGGSGDIQVTVDAPEGSFSQDVTLKADIVQDEKDNDAVASELDKAEVAYDGFVALDVRFEDADGNEVEPAQPVDVKFELPAGVVPEDAKDLAVHHLAEDESGAVASVDTVADAADATEGTVDTQADAAVAEFSVDGFSTFTITWNDPMAEADGAESEYAPADAEAAATPRAATGTNLLTETFTGSSVADPDSWLRFGTAGLTAASSDSAWYVGNHSVGTSNYLGANHGPGYLQLTDASGGDTGTVLYNEPVQSRLGLDISFYQWQFNGSTNPPADGIGFFLTDGSYDLSEQGPEGGGCGGALGYSAIENNGNEDDVRPGIEHGVLGIGLDVFGNFTATNQVGGNDNRDATNRDGSDSHRYSVTVRGAGKQDAQGNWVNGYERLAYEQLNYNQHGYLHTNAPRQNAYEQNVGDQANGVLVTIHISPLDDEGNQYLTVTLTDSNQNTITPIDNLKLEEKLPDLVKFGFSASTGSNNDAHYIRGLKASTVRPVESGILLTKSVNHDVQNGGTDKTVFNVGDEVPYMFVVQNVGGSKLTGITIDDPYIENVTLNGVEVGKGTEGFDLEIGEQVVCYGTYVLKNEDIAAAPGSTTGTFTNTATASGYDDGGQPVWSTDDEVITTVPQQEIDPPVISKKIGDNQDGSYTLALDVIGNSNEGVIEGQGEPLDIVLVLDTSGSMSGSKLTNLKNAANSFIDATAENNRGLEQDQQTRLAIVQFAKGAYTRQGLNYVTDQNAQQYKSTINQFQASGSTYAEEGLQQAQDVLDSDGRDDVQQIVIFFTDGEPNHGNGFDNEVAAEAVNTAHEMKQGGTIIYAIGVMSRADASVTNDDGFNEYMNGVSSNYPNATAEGSNGGLFGWGAHYTTTFNARAEGDYYFATEDASQIEDIFEDITEDINVGTSYSAVSIVDQLSEYAEITDAIKYDDASDSDGFHRVTEGVTLKVEQPNGEGWQEVQENVPYNVYYMPSDSEESTGTIKVVFDADYKLKKGYKYTVQFDVQPTDKAYADYANNVASGGNGYGNTVGNEGTDLYEENTSSLRPGFYSNHDAWVDYSAFNEPQEPVHYPHPVLQVKTLVVEGALNITKTLKGHDLEENMFDFTVTPVAPIDASSSADESAQFAGFTSTGVQPFTNTYSAADGVLTNVRTGNKLTITPDMAGDNGSKTYAYEYREVGELHEGIDDVSNGQIVFDSHVYRIEVKVEYKNATLSATIVKYQQNSDGSWSPLGDSITLTPASPKPSSPISIDFVNEFKSYSLNVHKYVWNDVNGNGAVDDGERGDDLPNAEFTVTPENGSALDPIMTGEDGNALFTGLGEKVTYRVSETRVPAGYQKAEDRYVYIENGIAYLVDEDGVHIQEDGTDVTLDLSDGAFQMEIGDKEMNSLPTSGSSGTVILGAVGVAAVTVAAAYLASRKGMLPR